MNYVLELLKPSTFQLLWSGLKLTVYISSISVILSILFGMVLAIMRNGKNPIFKWIATIYSLLNLCVMSQTCCGFSQFS